MNLNIKATTSTGKIISKADNEIIKAEFQDRQGNNLAVILFSYSEKTGEYKIETAQAK
jgi:hypothetical protein